MRRRHEARRDLLEARRQDIEETAGSRFLKGHKGRAIGLLKDLVRVESGWSVRWSQRSGRSPMPSCTTTASVRSPTLPRATARSLRSRRAGSGPMGLAGERKLLAAVVAEPGCPGHRQHGAPRRLPRRDGSRGVGEAGPPRLRRRS